jgi:hypothetical protein
MCMTVLRSIAVICFLVCGATSMNAQVPAFALRIGGTSEDHIHRTAVDNDGNIVAVGRFFGTIDADPGAGTFNLTSNGFSDLFVGKYTSTGTLIWAFNVGGNDRDAAYGVAIDNANNIYITGYFRNTVDFDPSAGTANVTSNGNTGGDPGYSGEIYLAKYDANGTYAWAFNIGGTTKSDDGQDIVVDNSGNLILTGFFAGSNVDFDPSGSSFLMSSVGEELFMAKYTTNGLFLWARQMGEGGSASEAVRQLAVDNSDNIYITGFFTGSADFDPGAGTATLTASSTHEGYIARYSSTGDYVWAYQFGGTGFNQGWAIDVDPINGFVYISGVVQGTGIRFTAANGTSFFGNIGGNDAFFAKYSLAGNLSYAAMIAGPSNEESYDIVVDEAANCLYVTGYFEGTTDFNPAPQAGNLTANGAKDVFLAKYNLNGTYAGAFKIGSATADDFGMGLSLAGSDIIVDGSFTGSNVDFDPSANTLLRSAAGNFDGFVARYTWLFTLPVTIKNFRANNTINSEVNLSWTLTDETEVTGINAQRSLDGINFTTISNIPSKGSAGDNYYGYKDRFTTSQPDKVHYRIEVVRKDDSKLYSNILVIRLQSKNAILLELQPNPARDHVQLTFSSAKDGMAVVQIIDGAGKSIYQQRETVTRGTNIVLLNGLQRLSRGLYTITWKMDGELRSEQLVVQ